MKFNRFNYLMLGLAGLAMTACSSDEPGGDNTGKKGEERFIGVTIVNSGLGTMADDTDPNPFPDGYEDGTEAENAVNNARCYFFNPDGSAFTVQPSGESWNDFVPTSTATPGAEENNVAYVCEGTVVLTFDENQQAENKIPAKMVAVLNIPAGATEFDKPTMSLDDLSALTVKYSETEIASLVNATGNFFMSNSVYRADDGTSVVNATEIQSTDIKTSHDLAKESPVSIYVERMAAKITVDEKTTTFPIYKYSDKEGENEQYTFTYTDENGQTKTEQLSVKILGFAPTKLAESSYVLKNIDPSWTAEELGFGWNMPSRHRSFWATSTGSNFWDPFTFADVQASGFNAKYCLENTTDVADNRTKMLVAAQIVDKEGNAFEIAEWNGARYTVAGLKQYLATHLADKLYTKVSDTEYKALDGNSIDFVLKSTEEGSDKYSVKPILKEGTYYKQTGENTYETVQVTAYNTALAKSPTMVWKNGLTYYYFDIEHYGTEGKPGQYGVVRNHVYKYTIDEVFGLGTPVFDPNIKIDPENPKDKYSYIAAKINILSWHIVNKNVTLGK